MACKYNIKVVEHNDFTLLFPLKKRTYVASLPIDEDIVIEDLENVKVTIGGVEFASTLDERGVTVAVAYDALERGTYDIIITAEYHGAQIRAAYFEGLTIVDWNMQSDAEQYLPGSPIVMQAAFVIGGPLTDAELEALKQQYRERNAELAQAIADAEAAKEEYDRKAEALDDVAQQSTLTQGVADIRDDISHIDIDTSTLAKETTAEAAKQAALAAKQAAEAIVIPSDYAKEATSQEILQKVNAITPDPSGQQAVSAAINAKGGSSQPTDSLYEMSQEILAIPLVPQSAEWLAGTTPNSVAAAFGAIRNLVSLVDDNTVSCYGSNMFAYCQSLQYAKFSKLESILDYASNMFGGTTALRKLEFPRLQSIVGGNQNAGFAGENNSGLMELYMPQLLVIPIYFTFRNMPNLEIVDFSEAYNPNTSFSPFGSCPNLIDFRIGNNLHLGANLGSWNPTNALSSTSSSLVHEGESFANNLEKLLYNIREHLAANLRTDVGNKTIRFHANVKAAIEADQATMDAFPANWTIA